MNKTKILQLNAVPDGKEAWLTYDEYQKLKHLFEAVPLPSPEEETTDDPQYIDLHRFLTKVAGLNLPLDEAAIHFNAFALIRRGYQIETITQAEYKHLLKLMAGLEQPDVDDMDLYSAGGHRDLYNYLTKGLGLSVQPGRGPVWHRARMLIKKYEAEQITP